MKLDTALQMLRRDPMTFLRTNVLRIAGSATSGPCIYHLGYLDQVMRSPTTNEGFNFEATQAMARSNSAGYDGKSTQAVPVHNLRMIPRSEGFEVTDIEAYALGGGGPDILVTGQLSACVFAAQRLPGGGLVVGHIQPGGALQGGAALGQTIRITGRFRGHGRVTHVFSYGRDYSSYAYVVGVRTGGTWHLYGQKVTTTKGPVIGVTQIV